jgi:predicted transcriptional regulator
MIPAPIWMMGHIENFWLAKGLFAALELNVAEQIDQGKNTIEQLARVTNTNQDALFRVMRMLCAHEIFRLSNEGVYSITPYSKVMLEGNGSVKYMLQSHLGKIHSDLFSEMDYTLKTGKNAAEKLYRKDIFDYVQDHPGQHELFVKGMGNTSALFAPVLFSSYNFTPFSHIIDVGGGDGTLLCNILTKHPDIKAILLESKQVIERAKKNIELHQLTNRISTVEGDFFSEIPAGGNLYVLKNIMHDWDDHNCIRILKNIHQAMAADSKLLIIETIINNDNKYSYGKMLDIMMLLGTKDGRERTLEEYKGILKDSGFAILKVVPTVSPFSLIECIKQQQ